MSQAELRKINLNNIELSDEDEIDDLSIYDPTTGKFSDIFADPETDDEEKWSKTFKPKPKKDDKVPPVRSSKWALTINAKDVLDRYIKKSPQYNTVLQQIEILSIEYDNYKRIGNDELAEKTKEMINDLSSIIKKMKKVIKGRDAETRKAAEEALRTNKEYLDIIKKRRTLKKMINDANPGSIINRYRKLKKDVTDFTQLQNTKNLPDYETGHILDDKVYDIDNPRSLKKLESRLKYEQSNPIIEFENMIGFIADLLDMDAGIIANMTTTDIEKMLRALPKDHLEQLRAEYALLNDELQEKRAEIQGYHDITNTIFDMFDFSDPDEIVEYQSKEMLIASQVPFVQARAYKLCREFNAHRYENDLIGYGLLFITEEANKWYERQKNRNLALSFTGYAWRTVGDKMREMLYELMGGGSIGGGSWKDNKHYRRKKIENFRKLYPTLNDLPDDMVQSLMSGIIADDFQPHMMETDLRAMIGGVDADNVENPMELVAGTTKAVELENMELIESFKQLFSLFRLSQYNRPDDKTVFDELDYKIFKLFTGIEYDITETSDGKKIRTIYNQEDMANIILDFKISRGMPPKMGQSSISTAINRIKNKLYSLIKEGYNLRPAMDYLDLFGVTNNISTLINEFETKAVEDEYYIANKQDSNFISKIIGGGLDDLNIDDDTLDHELTL